MNLINEIKNPRVYALGFFDYIYIFIKQKKLRNNRNFNLQNGGQGWIRTIVAYGDGFTVRSL